MKTLRTEKASDTNLTQGALYALRCRLGGRRALIAGAILIVMGGVVLNWGWLVAAGIAPLILAALPCAVMCVLGLCANMMGRKSCPNEQNGAKVAATSDTGHSEILPSSTVSQGGTGQTRRL
jgi:hypothetical protein